VSGAAEPAPTLRLDKLLWFLRLARTRSLAQRWAEDGHIRVNGRRVERSAATVRAGDVVTLVQRSGLQGSAAIAIRVLALPTRRGAAPEAQAHYRRLDETLDAVAASRLVPEQQRPPHHNAPQGSPDP
jgi:ribosome-associated heat shock protein Hsp15